MCISSKTTQWGTRSSVYSGASSASCLFALYPMPGSFVVPSRRASLGSQIGRDRVRHFSLSTRPIGGELAVGGRGQPSIAIDCPQYLHHPNGLPDRRLVGHGDPRLDGLHLLSRTPFGRPRSLVPTLHNSLNQPSALTVCAFGYAASCGWFGPQLGLFSLVRSPAAMSDEIPEVCQLGCAKVIFNAGYSESHSNHYRSVL